MTTLVSNLASTGERYHRRIARLPFSVVVQPTGFCNIACDYCYLPDKDNKTPMTVEVAQAVAMSVEEMADQLNGRTIEIVWHSGEPMSLGVRRFTELLAPFEDLRRRGVVKHEMQTNATLVSNAWCDLIKTYDVGIGVSIDGPGDMSGHRIDRSGRPVLSRVMKGVERLRQNGIPFTTISVVSCDTIEQPDMLLDFLRGIGSRQIGLNIEEADGVNNVRKVPGPEESQAFWAAVIGWVRSTARATGSNPEVREINRMGRYVALDREQKDRRRADHRTDPLPTVTTNGDVFILSPELAGTPSEKYGDFRAGNVLEASLSSILDSAHELLYVQEYLTALDSCESKCGFWDFCLGSQASNRFFEHGSLLPAETNYCRVTDQAQMRALVSINRKEGTR